jgi:hypothetical protein
MRAEARPQPGQSAVVARAVAMMVIRSGDGMTCSTARPGGIKGRMCFDKRIQQLQASGLTDGLEAAFLPLLHTKCGRAPLSVESALS